MYSARFAPDFRSIVYGAAWNGKPLQLFSTVGDSLLTQPLNVTDANLLAISRTGELAVVLHGLTWRTWKRKAACLPARLLPEVLLERSSKTFRGRTGMPTVNWQ